MIPALSRGGDDVARPSLDYNPKFKLLVRCLGLPRPYVYGLLEVMWQSAWQNGEPIIGTAEEVEAAAEWPGEPGLFLRAVVDCRLLDERPDGRYEVHDFWDHAPAYVQRRGEREAQRQVRGETIASIRAEAGRKGGLAKASKRIPLASTPSKRLANGSPPAPAPAHIDTETKKRKASPAAGAAARASYPEWFSRWWELYSKQTGRGTEKAATYKAACKLKPKERDDEALLAATRTWFIRRLRLKQAGVFVPEAPDPIRFIRKRRWEDEFAMPAKSVDPGEFDAAATKRMIAERTAAGECYACRGPNPEKQVPCLKCQAEAAEEKAKGRAT
jgi:hypothetical protein